MSENFQTLHNVGVFQANHSFDFGISHGLLPRVELTFESFQRVDLFGVLVLNLINDAERAFTQGFEDFKAIHEDCASRKWLIVLGVLTHFVKVGFCCCVSLIACLFVGMELSFVKQNGFLFR